MNKEKSISVLNKLVEINQDRIEGYETASKETEEHDLKTLFSRFIRTSEDCKEQLITEIQRLDGTPVEGTKNTGKFFRAWMEVKAALISKDRRAILNSCEFGEDAAVAMYEKVLANHTEDLTFEQLNTVRAQYFLIKSDHDEVKFMRDEFLVSK